jgi:hypothetical protein
MNIFYVVAITGELKGISEKIWTPISRKSINYSFNLSGYFFSIQSSIYLFTIQERVSSLCRLKEIFTDEHLKGKELAQ